MRRKSLKKITSVIMVLLLILSSLSAVSVFAATEETDDGFVYEVSEGEVTITGYTGYEFDVVIPSNIDGYPVTAIGDEAFSYCEYIFSVTIPEGVTTIGDSAFWGCMALDTVDISDSVKSIGAAAFAGCEFLSDVTLPSGLTEIPHQMFMECFYLSDIDIPDSVTSIGDYAFFMCENLSQIEIPSGIKAVGSDAFYGTAYYNDYYNWDNGMLYLDYILLATSEDASGECTIKEGTTVVAYGAFAGSDNVTKVTIPEGVTRISDSMLSSCGNLTEVIIPDSVKEIGDMAFWGSTALSKIEFPSELESIGEQAFQGCDSLQTVTIPASVTEIETMAFCQCDALTSINVDADNTEFVSVDGVLFSKDKSLLKAYPAGKSASSYNIPNTVTDIERFAFSSAVNLTDVVLPDTVRNLGSAMFSNCGKLANVNIPNGIQEIPSTMFYGCYSLKKITLPDTITKIGTDAFENCITLTDINIPNTVTDLGMGVFMGCRFLKEIVIPESLTAIKYNTFRECKNLESITIPKTVTSIDNYAFRDCTEKLTIYGYAGSCAEEFATAQSINFVALVDTPSQELAFSGASLTLYDNISINFKAAETLFTQVGYEDPYVVFEMNGDEYTVSEYIVENGKYVFDFSDISPANMNDTVKATLYATYSGTEHQSETAEYSVATYCYNMLEKYADEEYAALRTLLVDLLNYGAQSQIYTGYNTDNLVNSALTEEQQSWATGEAPVYESVQNLTYETVDNPTVSWKGAGLNLEESVTMRFKIAAQSIENLTVKVKTDEKEWIIPSENFLETTGGYYVLFSGLNAGQMSESVYLTVYDGDVAVSNTICYSIESYVYAKQGTTDQNLANLLDAMMKYGTSAEQYVG